MTGINPVIFWLGEKMRRLWIVGGDGLGVPRKREATFYCENEIRTAQAIIFWWSL